LEVQKKKKSKPGSVTLNLECDEMWRKCDVTSFRVLLCFIKPILGNRYGPGVSSRASLSLTQTQVQVLGKFRHGTTVSVILLWCSESAPRMPKFWLKYPKNPTLRKIWFVVNYKPPKLCAQTSGTRHWISWWELSVYINPKGNYFLFVCLFVWISKTHLNHRTKRMVNIQLTT